MVLAIQPCRLRARQDGVCFLAFPQNHCPNSQLIEKPTSPHLSDPSWMQPFPDGIESLGSRALSLRCPVELKVPVSNHRVYKGPSRAYPLSSHHRPAVHAPYEQSHMPYPNRLSVRHTNKRGCLARGQKW